MGTYKRPLPEGVACEDSRLEFNPKLGAGKAVEVETTVYAEPSTEAKPTKGKKAKEEVVEAPAVVLEVETIAEPEAENAVEIAEAE